MKSNDSLWKSNACASWALQEGLVKQCLKERECVWKCTVHFSLFLWGCIFYLISPQKEWDLTSFPWSVFMGFAYVCVMSYVSAELSKAFLCTPEHFALWSKHQYVCGVNISISVFFRFHIISFWCGGLLHSAWGSDNLKQRRGIQYNCTYVVLAHP